MGGIDATGGIGATGGMEAGGMLAGGMLVDGPAAGGAVGGYTSRIATEFRSSPAGFFGLLLDRPASTGGLACDAATGGPPIETFAPTPIPAEFPELAAPEGSLPAPRWAGTGIRTVCAFALFCGLTWNRFWQ